MISFLTSIKQWPATRKALRDERQALREQELKSAEQQEKKRKCYDTWVEFARCHPIPEEIFRQLRELPSAPSVEDADTTTICEAKMEIGTWYRLPWTHKSPYGEQQVVIVVHYVEQDNLDASQWGGRALGLPSAGINKYASVVEVQMYAEADMSDMAGSNLGSLENTCQSLSILSFVFCLSNFEEANTNNR